MRSIYKAVVVVFLVMVFLSSPMHGQGSKKKGWGYSLFGAGVASGYHDRGFLHYGVGVETLLKEGFGIGVELGYLDRFNTTAEVGVFSPGGIYAFNTDKTTMPFVTAGYTFFLYDERKVNGAFFGGGVNYLIGNNWGIRIDGRDLIGFREGDTAHYLSARFGVLFSWD